MTNNVRWPLRSLALVMLTLAAGDGTNTGSLQYEFNSGSPHFLNVFSSVSTFTSCKIIQQHS